MEESVLLGTKPLVDSIRHFIRDPSGVFSVLVHGPDHFSVPNIRTKLECYQLIIQHKMSSNLYDNLSK